MELRTDDLTLHYEDDGDASKPPILLLHGITQSTATWGWLVPHLAGDHRVVRLDFRGHGRSGRTPGAYSFPGYIADATAVCERVLQQPAVLIGHSLGGGTQLDASVLDPVLDGSLTPAFDSHAELPVPGIVVAGDPASPDTIVRGPEVALLAEHSPKVEVRVQRGVGHLIHDSRSHRQAVLDAVRDLLARV